MLDSAKDKFRSVSKSLQEQADMVGQANALESELRQRESQVAELQAKLAQAGSAAPSKAADERAAALQARVNELTEKLKQASAGDKNDAKLKAQLLEMTQRLEHAAATNEQLRAQSEQLRSHLKEAGKKSKGQGQIPAEVGQAVVTRWRRLRIMRSLLHEQGEKLRSGGEALRARVAQCEELLSQRDQQALVPRPRSARGLGTRLARAACSRSGHVFSPQRYSRTRW